jgi:Na+-translocating ferredoxin:NAD+ oxidoreductase RNF subunit RnfB
MEITINTDVCTSPYNCMKCITVCPMNILVLKPKYRDSSSAFDNYEVSAIFKKLCNGCMKCVEVCPKHCLQIEF